MFVYQGTSGYLSWIPDAPRYRQLFYFPSQATHPLSYVWQILAPEGQPSAEFTGMTLLLCHPREDRFSVYSQEYS